MAYDIIVSVQKLQNDLITINNAIIQKQNPLKIIKEEDKKEK